MNDDLKFTKLYKFLFEDPTYNNLPAKAKLLYALLTERQNLSKANVRQNGIQSQFIDEDGRLFSIYSNYELIQKLNMSKPTIIKLKKQLMSFGLLEEVQLGNNQNNRLYPKKPYDEYFYAYDIDEFYRLPHALFDNPYYKNLSADSIIAYAFYLSRYEYSVYKNHFFDNNKNVYCVLTNEELALRLSCERKKISRIKKELEVCGLIRCEKSTFGKASRLYINLPKPYQIKEVKKWDVGELKNGTSGSKKMGRRGVKKWDTSDTYSSNTYSSYIDYSDMNDMNEDNILDNNNSVDASNHSDHSNHKFNTNEDNFNSSSSTLHENFDYDAVEQDTLLQQLPVNIQLALKHFNNQEIKCIKSVLNKAKTNYNRNTPVNERVMYEDCEIELGNAIKRIKLFAQKKSENICDLEAYMMQTFKQVFVYHVQAEQHEDSEEVRKDYEEFEPKNEMQAMAKKMFSNCF
ncbi:TPA: replication initiator protein A [Staphylococcus aureus]|nr:replication initiator protein A [Staphylococcus aureus]